jgi:hypothetical protein
MKCLNNIQGLAFVKGDMHKIVIDLLGLIVIDLLGLIVIYLLGLIVIEFRPFSFLG